MREWDYEDYSRSVIFLMFKTFTMSTHCFGNQNKIIKITGYHKKEKQ